MVSADLIMHAWHWRSPRTYWLYTIPRQTGQAQNMFLQGKESHINHQRSRYGHRRTKDFVFYCVISLCSFHFQDPFTRNDFKNPERCSEAKKSFRDWSTLFSKCGRLEKNCIFTFHEMRLIHFAGGSRSSASQTPNSVPGFSIVRSELNLVFKTEQNIVKWSNSSNWKQSSILTFKKTRLPFPWIWHLWLELQRVE